ncbi:hypothetical protein O181_054503 [Austropuccinia psidii MF-1]|uniref:Uncharacterized protein n=1 Tax=Austropuccinia psidii MF-1 TaxID=1389203 RepID=A0A9Q3E6B5_9BASI|nr:hypothetical protein [Austropuccinia psidii MF-1]
MGDQATGRAYVAWPRRAAAGRQIHFGQERSWPRRLGLVSHQRLGGLGECAITPLSRVFLNSAAALGSSSTLLASPFTHSPTPS